jgi:hypothetical protein
MICNDIAISTPPVCAQQLRQEKAALESRIDPFTLATSKR